ncbi:MAG: aspartate carbamoyltransferase catalytic subunit [Candidatus Alcyoniella australis]|nr:aspartate carbamoyltransferase catalytic subunit [Candidatus Alcyoniella australis]
MRLNRKDLLGLEDIAVDEIKLILDTADSFKEFGSRIIKKVPALRGKTVVNLFYEPSTRTRTSFEIAGKRLSADVVNFSASQSSVGKGETLIDTMKNIEAMQPDLIVVRHGSAGAPHMLARMVECGVINAGDGAHEHPSQALLDMLMIRDVKGRINGLTVAIIGDISHSRVARSNIYGLTRMGARVRVCGPKTMIPAQIERMGVEVFHDVRKAISGVDVIMMLRIQLERQAGALLPSLREYARHFGLTPEIIKAAKPDATILHPGPINRGVEISSEVADCQRSMILNQVTNGVAVRMALLYLLTGGAGDETAD